MIRELYEAGCRNIQLDDCTWGMMVDSEYWEKKLGAGADIEEEARKYLRINNLAIEGKPEDLVTILMCAGGTISRHMPHPDRMIR